ncbi:acyl-CoA acyltransferase [Candidatus Sulfurimonas marisnigri]|uniref:Acyl-CoA acyltransferase n=1 Tax=Candidatus Sulfurimonas marisnigri TaxID=2740405 RepID=A0A7S7LZH7_9BACT|nr:acyl-CoA acyltransferase [Candidatus Sulfurimonas marisnigri]QOY54323.1 acyl-CoA acyltransferase [Candidatus Sulfurimonas marisnigri]
MSIKIRKATSDDSAFLAQMILQSSRAGKKVCIYDLLFASYNDKDTLENLEKLITATAKSNCHYSNFLVAEMDGKCVGSLCSYEPRIATKEVFRNALQEIGVGNENSEYEDIVNYCGFELNTRTLIFDFMEELEGFIDVGVLKALMQKSLLTARLKGYRIAQTVVEIGSLETLLYYKKLGFKEVNQKECELYREKFGRAGFVLLAYEF